MMDVLMITAKGYTLEEAQLIVDGIKYFGRKKCLEAYKKGEGANTTGWTYSKKMVRKYGSREYLATLLGDMLLTAGQYLDEN